MYTIKKEFDFCYGHRVWSQKLNPEFSLDSCLKCRHLHGHQGKIIVSLQAEELTDGMVTDFKHLNWFKKWLDNTLDHKFIMDGSDPLREVIFPLSSLYGLWDNETQSYSVSTNTIPCEDEDGILEDHIKELYEGVIFVNFVPTSENLTKWLHTIIQIRMKPLGVTVSSVQFFETPKSQSIYTPNI